MPHPDRDPPAEPTPAGPPAAAQADALLQPRETVSPGVTRRGVLIGVLIGVAAIVVALASVYVRRTRLEQSTQFWGRPVIRALQSSAHVRMRLLPERPLVWPAQDGGQWVDLSDLPGVAHLRHALLDDRHYRWETLQQVPVDVAVQRAAQAAASEDGTGGVDPTQWVVLELDGTPPGVENEPEGEIRPATLLIELGQGWVCLAEGERCVRLTRRARPAVRHFLLTANNIKPLRYDDR